MKRNWFFLLCTMILTDALYGQSNEIDTRVDGSKGVGVQNVAMSNKRVKMEPQLEPLGPIRLGLNDNTIDLRDFVVDYKSIKDVKFDGVPIAIKDRFITIPSPKTAALHELTLNVNGDDLSIPVFKSNKNKVVFEYKATSDKISKVTWAGSLNGWNNSSHPLAKDKSGIWKLTMEVEDGEYPYRIWEDGQELLDANNAVQKDNGLGGKNSVWVVGNARKSSRIRTFMMEGSTLYLLAEGNVDRYVYYLNNKKGGEGKVESGKFTIALPKTMWSGYLRVYAESNGQ